MSIKASPVGNGKGRVVWQPLPGSQTLALSCPCEIILYHGTRGPGKTDAQLYRFRRWVGRGYGRHWRGIIFDREYKNLDDLVSKSQRWFPMFGDGARFLSSKSDYKWVWPTGEELMFRAIKKSTDYWGYHGQEFPFIGWNEITKYPTDELFESMMSCNRSSFRPEDFPIIEHKTKNISYLPEIPLEVFATCNPYGAGHNWVKRKLIGGRPPGTVHRTSINVFDPKIQERRDVVKTSTHLFGSYKENKYLDAKYIATLESITDKNKKEAWLKGNWDIVAGGMFDDCWDKQVHAVKRFIIPSGWRIDRSFDWGSSKPFSVGWWAESDGSDVILSNGTTVSTIKGDLFRINEWYGWSGKTNEGLRMLASEIAAGIVEREIGMGIIGKVRPGPADGSIFDMQNGNSIAVDMAKQVRVRGSIYPGVKWLKADKSAGSRKGGWEKMRSFMKSSIPKPGLPRETPGLFIFEDECPMFMELVPVLPRDEDDQDDVDTESEDHIGDETRYRILASAYHVRSGTTVGST